MAHILRAAFVGGATALIATGVQEKPEMDVIWCRDVKEVAEFAILNETGPYQECDFIAVHGKTARGIMETFDLMDTDRQIKENGTILLGCLDELSDEDAWRLGREGVAGARVEAVWERAAAVREERALERLNRPKWIF